MIKLEIKQHSLPSDVVEVEFYDAAEVMKILMEKDEYGNRVNEFITFGQNIYSTISVQSVRVIENESNSKNDVLI